jgi:hypothetical protein
VKSTDSVAEDYTNKEEAPAPATMDLDTTPPPLPTVGVGPGAAVMPVKITATIVLAPAVSDRELHRSTADRDGYVHTRNPWSELSVYAPSD